MSVTASKTLHIIRGLSGAGKSTLAASLSPHVFEADQFFVDSWGGYHWDARRLPQAHADCQGRVEQAMRRGITPLAVSNVFVNERAVAPYRTLAQLYGYTVTVHDLFDAGLTDMQLVHRNVHRVPLATVEKMRKSYVRFSV